MSDDLARRWVALPTREEWIASLPCVPLNAKQEHDREIKRQALTMVHEHWGGTGAPVCAWCGKANIRVLQFDHLYSDGAENRKRIAGGAPTYQAIVSGQIDPATGQVLCANCNAEKRNYEAERKLINHGRSKKTVLDNTTPPVVDLEMQGRDTPLLGPAADLVAPEKRALSHGQSPSTVSLPSYDCP